MIKIDLESFVPIYEQIKTGFRKDVGLGALKPDDDLPSIRELAQVLLINPNTVARAYRDLEAEGLIVTRRGKGCRVAAEAADLVRRDGRQMLEKALDEVIGEAARFGLDPEETKKLFEQRLKQRADRGAKGGRHV
jgi:GntR family transcriptional regulator